jgi:hypothetical protein
MKPINTPVAIRMEFVGFDVSTRLRPKSSARASSGTARAARSIEAAPSEPPILITQRKRRSKAVLPPLAWGAGWARKPDEPEPGSTS